jgi:predicted dehydrogenase
MKFLIAGFGSIGRRHLRNLLALGERDILLYRTHRSTLPDGEFAGFPVETNLDTALAGGVDAVIIANPTSLHLKVAVPAAQAGCHLLIEKPLSHSLKGIQRLLQAVKASGSRVLVGYQFRFHPGLQRIAQLLQEGAIGRPVSVRAHWGEYLPDWHPWEDYRQAYAARQDLGGGVVLTLSHPIDYLRWLLGDIRQVWALTARSGELDLQGVEDIAEIGLKFQNGCLGSIHLDYLQRPPTHQLEIIGSQGTLRWDNASGEASLYMAETGAWEHFPVPVGFERNHLFLAEMRHFLDVARGASQPLCTLEDGIAALRICQLVLETAQGKNSRDLIDEA